MRSTQRRRRAGPRSTTPLNTATRTGEPSGVSVPAEVIVALDLLIDRTAAGMRAWARGDLVKLRVALSRANPLELAGIAAAVEAATGETRETFGQAVGVEAVRRLEVGLNG